MSSVYELFPRLKERRRQIAGTLSGGEQQMLVMGRALMSNPKLLMLDEPSMGLAPILVRADLRYHRGSAQGGTTMLLVEQNAQMALSIADARLRARDRQDYHDRHRQELLHDDNVRKAYLGG